MAAKKKAENFKLKKCAFCGKIFMPTSRPQKYCSTTCSATARTKKNKQNKQKKKSVKVVSEIDTYIPKNKPNEGIINMTMEARKAGMSYGKYVLYLQTQQRKEKKAENFKLKKCAFCGKIFMPTFDRPQKYCSTICSATAKSVKVVSEKAGMSYGKYVLYL